MFMMDEDEKYKEFTLNYDIREKRIRFPSKNICI